jgi:hypothetical protein
MEIGMAQSSSCPVDLQNRLARLEREQRWWRGLSLLFMAASGSVLVAFKDPPPEVLQAERVELVTRQGVRQAQFSADSLGLTVTLFDLHGHEAASFRFNDEPRLTVLNEARKEVVGLGAPRPQHLAQ